MHPYKLPINSINGLRELHAPVMAERQSLPPTLLLIVTISLLLLAFVPVTPGGEATSGDLSLSRIREVVFLLLGVGMIGTYVLTHSHFNLEFNNPTFFLVSLYAYWGALSAIWSLNPVLTLAKSTELWLIAVGAALVISVASRFLSSMELINMLAWILVGIIVLMIAINVVVWGNPLPMATLTDNMAEQELVPVGDIQNWTVRPRLVLAYAHPLSVADLLALVMIVLYVAKVSRLLKLVSFPMLIVMMRLADGRAAQGAVVVSIFAICFFLQVKRSDIRILLVAGTIGLLLGQYALQTPDELDKLSTTLIPEDIGSLNGRTGVWSYALTKISERFFTGYGYGASRFVLMEVFSWAGQAHNIFIEVLLTTGFVGFMLVLCFTVYTIRTIVVTKNALLLGIAVYHLLQGMFNSILFVPGVPMLALILSLLHATQSQWRRGSKGGVNSGAYSYGS